MTVRLLVHGLTVDVDLANADQRARLKLDYGPFVVDSADGDPDLRVTARHSDRAPVADLLGKLGDAIVLAPGSCTLIGPHAADDEAYLSEIRPYLTSSIIQLLHTTRGVVHLHASAARVGARATVFIGEKKSGKTSLMLATVAAGARYLSNEITLAIPDPTGPKIGGLPQGVAVATGCMHYFAAAMPEWHIPDPLDVEDTGRGVEELFQLELGEKYVIPRAVLASDEDGFEARTGMIVFPEPALQLARPEARQLDEDTAAAMVLQNVDFFLKWGQRLPTDVDRYFEPVRAMIGELAATVPCYHLRWTTDHRANAELIGQLPAKG